MDANQATIVQRLRQRGATVLSLAPMGKGVPDLLVGYGGLNVLLEVKNPKAMQGRGKLNAEQREFCSTWTGQVLTVWTVAEAERAVFGDALGEEASRDAGHHVERTVP